LWCGGFRRRINSEEVGGHQLETISHLKIGSEEFLDGVKTCCMVIRSDGSVRSIRRIMCLAIKMWELNFGWHLSWFFASHINIRIKLKKLVILFPQKLCLIHSFRSVSFF
jgi:hypothetical protein